MTITSPPLRPSKAIAGSYDIEVVQLAAPAKLKSAVFTGGPTSVVGTGTLTLSQGGNAFSVNIDSSNNTLAGIRDAINQAPGNTGVHATLLTGVAGSYLVLAGDKTGAANQLKVTQSGGDGGLAPLVYDPPNPTTMTSVDAQDAIVNVSDIPVHSATNTVRRRHRRCHAER